MDASKFLNFGVWPMG